jgi:hypothetical protein
LSTGTLISSSKSDNQRHDLGEILISLGPRPQILDGFCGEHSPG